MAFTPSSTHYTALEYVTLDMEDSINGFFLLFNIDQLSIGQSVEVWHCVPPHLEREALFDDFPCTKKEKEDTDESNIDIIIELNK